MSLVRTEVAFRKILGIQVPFTLEPNFLEDATYCLAKKIVVARFFIAVANFDLLMFGSVHSQVSGQPVVVHLASSWFGFVIWNMVPAARNVFEIWQTGSLCFCFLLFRKHGFIISNEARPWANNGQFDPFLSPCLCGVETALANCRKLRKMVSRQWKNLWLASTVQRSDSCQSVIEEYRRTMSQYFLLLISNPSVHLAW